MKIEQKIIKLLADYPEKEFYGQEIARELKCSKASISGILKSLVQKKIVSKQVKGRMKFYQVNSQNFEVKKLKINLAVDQLSPVLPKLSKLSQKIILFGSASRGEQTSDSDMDLFILSNDKNDVRTFLKKTSRSLRIKAIIKNTGEWSEMEIENPELCREIKNGITLYNYVPRI